MLQATLGQLLIASSALNHPNFERSVVLLCDQTLDGLVGLVLNQPTENVLGDVFDDMSCNFPLYIGGPVEKNTLHFIHKLGKVIPKSIEIAKGVYWNGDFECIKKMINLSTLKETDIKFFLGYSGWTIDQLNNELLSNDWVISEVDSDFIFEKNVNGFWRKTLLNKGGGYKIMANVPIDPRLN